MSINTNRRIGVKMNNQILQSIRDSAVSSSDHSKLMLVEQLEQAYDAIESMKASYNAMISASSGVAAELKKREEIISNLQSANLQLTSSMNQMLAGWKSLFELSVYSSDMFNCYDLLDMWKLVDRCFGSKNPEEMQINSMELMSIAAKLNSDSIFVDMRNRMVSYKEYYESNFGSVEDIPVVQDNSEPEEILEETENKETENKETENKDRFPPDKLISSLLHKISPVLNNTSCTDNALNEDDQPEDEDDQPEDENEFF
jgi:hypothetical protein